MPCLHNRLGLVVIGEFGKSFEARFPHVWRLATASLLGCKMR
jgi:hypothetical protein